MAENTISGAFGVWFGQVAFDGRTLDPKQSQRIINHSPGGFAWGYGGSGPAQLALALLLAAGVSPNRAVRHHLAFKQQIVASLPQRGDWTLKLDVAAWVETAEAVATRKER